MFVFGALEAYSKLTGMPKIGYSGTAAVFCSDEK